MGEYAMFKNREVKIGTCENMYYLRYEDRNKVRQINGNIAPANTLNLRWRLPFPDEDHVGPGSYSVYDRGVALRDFKNEDCAESAGTIQVKHPCGLLVNIPCYHGLKLPEANGSAVHFGWNGKAYNFFELTQVKNTSTGMRYCVQCVFCKQKWSYEWDEIEKFIPPSPLKDRLETYRN